MSKFLFPLGCTLFQHHSRQDMDHFLTFHGDNSMYLIGVQNIDQCTLSSACTAWFPFFL